jgi:hypothetical protein
MTFRFQAVYLNTVICPFEAFGARKSVIWSGVVAMQQVFA